MAEIEQPLSHINANASVGKCEKTVPRDFSDYEGCEHYKTKCKIKCNQCNVITACRVCHDEIEPTHTLSRNDVKRIVCSVCSTEQNTSNSCISCSIKFAEYHCPICNLWCDRSANEIFHCHKCNICRIGNPSTFFHCDKCNGCFPNRSEGRHKNNKCIEGSLSDKCQVCYVELWESRVAVKRLNCGHYMHEVCLDEFKENQAAANRRIACALCMTAIE